MNMPFQPQPSLTVRSFAEMIHMPAYEQMRILAEQKYPADDPARHRVPYYCEAKAAIRRFYRQDNNPLVVGDVQRHLQARGKTASRARAGHNSRVLEAFLESPEAHRRLEVRSFGTRKRSLHGVDLRLTFDLVADEKGKVKFKYYNMRVDEMDEELIRSTLELSSHLMAAEQIPHRFCDLEYFDFESGRLYRWSRPRKRTLQRAAKNADLVKTLWPTL
ncbi:MAG: hypothetical protein AAFN41_13475 [Planctomycetota bacterium]